MQVHYCHVREDTVQRFLIPNHIMSAWPETNHHSFRCVQLAGTVGNQVFAIWLSNTESHGSAALAATLRLAFTVRGTNAS